MARIVLLLICLCSGLLPNAQIPVEVFASPRRSTLDVMFFKYAKKQNAEPTRFLFFHRSRAAVDYRITSTTYLPQFGLTEAISWNHPRFKGLAPVAVAQILSPEFTTKAGIQYALLKPGWTVFSWFVTETRTQPDLDLFLLIRHTPVLSGSWRLFLQAESVNSFPLSETDPMRITQRFRLGLQYGSFQAGAGLDAQHAGITKLISEYHPGIFLRHEF